MPERLHSIILYNPSIYYIHYVRRTAYNALCCFVSSTRPNVLDQTVSNCRTLEISLYSYKFQIRATCLSARSAPLVIEEVYSYSTGIRFLFNDVLPKSQSIQVLLGFRLTALIPHKYCYGEASLFLEAFGRIVVRRFTSPPQTHGSAVTAPRPLP